jgi:chromosome segregation ATPase
MTPMPEQDELQMLEAVLDTYQREVGLIEAHRAMVERLREMLTLLRYQPPQRNGVKRQALRREIARLRAKVYQLKAQAAKPRERFKAAQELSDSLNAVRQVLESYRG